MSDLLEKILYFDKTDLGLLPATKSNILKYLAHDAVVSLKANGKEFYLVDINVFNDLHSKGLLQQQAKAFLRGFNYNHKINNLRASSSKTDALLPAEDGNYALVTSRYLAVGDMLYDTLDDVIKALGVEYVSESKLDRILNGESIRQVLKS